MNDKLACLCMIVNLAFLLVDDYTSATYFLAFTILWEVSALRKEVKEKNERT